MSGVRYQVSGVKAFTLVELLIAATIMAMIGLAILSTFAGGLKIYRRIQSYQDTQQDALISLEKMERDLRNALNFSKINFAGDAKKISFAGLIKIVDSDGNQNTALGKISYYFDGVKDVLIKEEQDYPKAVSEKGQRRGNRKELASIDEIKFSYFYFNSETNKCEWKESWGLDERLEEKKLPLGVKVELMLKSNGKDVKLDRTVFLPLAA